MSDGNCWLPGGADRGHWEEEKTKIQDLKKKKQLQLTDLSLGGGMDGKRLTTDAALPD